MKRTSRENAYGGPIWQLEIGRQESYFHKHYLTLSPCGNSSATPRLEAWIEAEVASYCQLTINEGSCSANLGELDQPVLRDTTIFARGLFVEVEKSRIFTCEGLSGMAFLAIDALCCHELVGKSADRAMHSLFWSAFVEHDAGLDYLHRYAAADQSNFYATRRLHGDLPPDDPVTDMLKRYSADALYRLRGWQKATKDKAFYDALHALALTVSTPATQGTLDRDLINFLKTQIELSTHGEENKIEEAQIEEASNETPAMSSRQSL